jgi:uncharacterized membrane protein
VQPSRLQQPLFQPAAQEQRSDPDGTTNSAKVDDRMATPEFGFATHNLKTLVCRDRPCSLGYVSSVTTARNVIRSELWSRIGATRFSEPIYVLGGYCGGRRKSWMVYASTINEYR